jgi:hypothetical protein
VTDRLSAVPRARLVIVTLGLLLIAVVAAVVVVALDNGGSAPAPSEPATGPTAPAAVARLHEIQHLLLQRSKAVLHHDKAAFLATVDPQSPAFRRRQSQMFGNLAAVHFASWSYVITADPRRDPPDAKRYADPVWAPSFFALRYRLARFDSRPTNLQQYPTFVKREGHWYLASLTDYAPRGLVSATDLWDYGKVTVLRRSDVLVLGFADERETMRSVAGDVHEAIPQVTKVWGTRWAQRAVVIVPRTMRQMALIDADRENLSEIAALTSAEVSTRPGHPTPVGDRITINPRNWPRLSPLGQSIVLRHELTHVATQSVTGAQTPSWLSEGFADYVGFKFSGISTSLAGHELQAEIEAGRVPSRLPRERGFRGSSTRLAATYEAAWFACRTIVERYGERKLVRFYRAVGTSSAPTAQAVRSALMSVLDLPLTRFVTLWRHAMVNELA